MPREIDKISKLTTLYWSRLFRIPVIVSSLTSPPQQFSIFWEFSLFIFNQRIKKRKLSESAVQVLPAMISFCRVSAMRLTAYLVVYIWNILFVWWFSYVSQFGSILSWNQAIVSDQRHALRGNSVAFHVNLFEFIAWNFMVSYFNWMLLLFGFSEEREIDCR